MSTRTRWCIADRARFLKIGAMSYGGPARRGRRTREHAGPGATRICAVFALRSTWATQWCGDGISRLDAGGQLRHPVTSSGDQGMAGVKESYRMIAEWGAECFRPLIEA